MKKQPIAESRNTNKMKKQLNEIKRMQQLAGLLKENQYDYRLPNSSVYTVNSNTVDDVFYNTSWSHAFNKRLLKSLLDSGNLFFCTAQNQKYLIYIVEDDITVLDTNNEIVDSEKNKELNNAVNYIISYKTK